MKFIKKKIKIFRIKAKIFPENILYAIFPMGIPSDEVDHSLLNMRWPMAMQHSYASLHTMYILCIVYTLYNI